jgi:hypothetical protein
VKNSDGQCAANVLGYCTAVQVCYPVALALFQELNAVAAETRCDAIAIQKFNNPWFGRVSQKA